MIASLVYSWVSSLKIWGIRNANPNWSLASRNLNLTNFINFLNTRRVHGQREQLFHNNSETRFVVVGILLLFIYTYILIY